MVTPPLETIVAMAADDRLHQKTRQTIDCQIRPYPLPQQWISTKPTLEGIARDAWWGHALLVWARLRHRRRWWPLVINTIEIIDKKLMCNIHPYYASHR
jgi:hypothetical protein